MKKLSMVLAALAFSLSSLAVSAEESTAIESTSGWFVGASFGSVGGGDIDEIESHGVSVGNSAKVMYGYHFNEYFALEQAWNNFGTWSIYGEEITNTGLTTELVVTFPMNEVFKPFVKAGLGNWFVDSAYYSESGSDFTYGAGVTLALGKFGLTLEHQVMSGLGLTSVGVKYNF